MKTRILKAVAVLALVAASVFALASCNLGKLANRYTVIFMVDGAEHARVYSNGKTVELPEAPVKGGYAFDGWYFDKDVWNDKLDPENLETTFLDVVITVHAKFITETAEGPGSGGPEVPGAPGNSDTDDTDKVDPDDDSWDDGNLDGDGWTDPNGGTTTPDSGTTTPDSGTTTPDSGTTTPDSGNTGSGSGGDSSNDDNLDGDGWTKP